MARFSPLALLLALLPALTLGARPAGALPIISEVFYDASGTDADLVFAELFGLPGTTLDGLVLEAVNGSDGEVTDSVLLSGVIPEDGLFVVADGGGDGLTSVAGADLVGIFDPQNGPDSVVLRDAAGEVLDAVGYGTFDPLEDVFAGEGSPAPDAPGGASLARVFADVDTGDNAADFLVQEAPTPGVAPLAEAIPVPEPGPGALGAAALALLALAGLRRPARAPSRASRRRRP